MDSRVYFNEAAHNPCSQSLGKSKQVLVPSSRRTTPRQLKHRYHGESKSVTGSHWQLPPSPTASQALPAGAKTWSSSTSASEVGSSAGSKPATVASTLFRSASLRLRSTLSRLKRSNSGHAHAKAETDSLRCDNASTSNRRSSDPLTVAIDPTSHDQMADAVEQTGRVPEHKAEVELVASPRRVKQSKMEVELHGAPGQGGAPPAPLPPGYTPWSTHIDPHPPQTPKTSRTGISGDNRLVYHSQGPLLLHPVVPKAARSSRCDDRTASGNAALVSPPHDNKNYYEDWILAPAASSSLPAQPASGTLNDALIDDCMVCGDLGRFNVRTGSFMGRYPVGGRNQRIARALHRPAPVGQNSLATEVTSPTCGGASRPLYLAPGAPSSGTTRSAPSPSLSSGTSNSGHAPGMPAGEPVPVAARLDSKPMSLETQPVTPNAAQLDVTSQKATAFDESQTAAVLELEPVLARLLYDVSSIEEFRSSLRPNASGTRDSSPSRHRSPEWTPDPAEGASRLGAQVPASDPGCTPTNRGHLRGISPAALPRGLDSVDWKLRRQINDLIQLEFAGQGQRFSPARSRTMVHTSSPGLKEKSDSLHSEPRSVDLEISQTEGERTRNRLHPFRWSTSGSGGRSGPAGRKTLQLNPLVRVRQTGASAGGSSSVDRINPLLDKTMNLELDRSRLSGSDLLTPGGQKKPDNGLTVAPQLLASCSKAVGDAMDQRVTFWSLSASQLVALRKLASMQLTPLAEKYCNNRSPFNWRILKYRVTGNLADGDTQNRPGQRENNLDIRDHSAEGGHKEADLFNTPSCDSPPASTQLAFPCLTDCPKVIRPGWTAYEGPVFGQTLAIWQQRCGYPLPPSVVNMMQHLVEVGCSAHGLFRRPGGKLRMLELRQKIEKHLDWDNFTEWQPYDVADLLKQFFRELPESLLTTKLSTLLVSVFNYVPPTNHLELLRWSMLCLPDENRTVLEKLLHLLNGLLQHSEVTQMSASNLAVCFAPSLFRLGGIHPGGATGNLGGTSSSGNVLSSSGGGVKVSPRRLRRTTSGPDPKDLADQRTAQRALTLMISNTPDLFQVSNRFLKEANLLSTVPQLDSIDSLASDGDWSPWLQETFAQLLRDCNSLKTKVWIPVSRDMWKIYQTGSGVGDSLDGLEMHYKKSVSVPPEPNSGCPLRTWRCSLNIPEVTAPVAMAIYRNQRASWDLDVSESRVLQQLSDGVDIHLLTLAGVSPQPRRQLLLLRGSQSPNGPVLDEVGGLALVSQSTAGPSSLGPSGSQSLGVAYEENVYIRPMAERPGCRVCLVSRVDVKGYTTEWYVNHWGHTLVRRLLNFRRACRVDEAPVISGD